MINFRRPYRALIHKKNIFWLRTPQSIRGTYLFGALALLLTGLSHFHEERLSHWRCFVTDMGAPLLQRTAEGCRGLINFSTVVGSLSHTSALTKQLKDQTAELSQWKRLAQHLVAENKSLRQQIEVAPERGYRVVSARVVLAPGGTLNQSLVIGAGTAEGVRKNQPVIAPEGLVGRVMEVGKHTARVLLVTDAASRVPAVVESSREQIILAGDNSDKPVMVHMADNNLPKPGEIVVTSGKGGIFPPGLEIGRVMRQGTSSGVRVHTPIQWSRLEFVQILAPYEIQTAHNSMH